MISFDLKEEFVKGVPYLPTSLCCAWTNSHILLSKRLLVGIEERLKWVLKVLKYLI